MEAIQTASRLGIDQCSLQFVFAQKPTECAHRPCRPFPVIIRLQRSVARRNRCRCFNRLLIKRFGFLANFAKTLGPNRSEVTGWRSLKRHEPTERSQTNLEGQKSTPL